LLTRCSHLSAVVLQLLAQDMDRSGNLSGRTTLEEVSLWADEVRGTAGDHPPWHYDDRPVCGSQTKQRYCAAGQCNSEQLERLVDVLANPQAPPRERNEALKWLVHLVGDLHQPLHASDNGDRGGNDVQVALQGVHTRGRTSLHKAWDTELVQMALNTGDRQRPPANLAALSGEAQVLLQEAGQGTPESWAIESNNLARNVAYHYAGFACNSRPEAIIILDREYIDAAQAVVRERLLLAGARLATLLNRALVAH
jgi:hypothetical protein